jgi:CspA family cold shock protein
MEYMRFAEPLLKGFWGDEEVMYGKVFSPEKVVKRVVQKVHPKVVVQEESSFTVVEKKKRAPKDSTKNSNKESIFWSGVVQNWNLDKGYGFITLGSGKIHGKNTIFCHNSQIKKDGFRSLERGQLVKFQVFENPTRKNIEAINVIEL